MLDLSNAPGILGLLRTLMLTIKTREFGVLIAGCMRVKHPNVEKGILAIVTPEPPRLDLLLLFKLFFFFFFNKRETKRYTSI